MSSNSRTAHNKDLRMIGGKDGDYRKYPYIVRLETKIWRINTKYITSEPFHCCTCSMLRSDWTLTAAHCVIPQGEENEQLFIRYGSKRPLGHNATVVKVLEYKVHPSFKDYIVIDLLPSKMENDIAVLKTEPVILPFYGRLSAVDYSSLFGQKAIACGYGMTNDTDNAGSTVIEDTLTLNRPLQVVKVMLMRCTDKDTILQPSLCIARKCGRIVAAGEGDSGGPLLHKSGVVGVMSLGREFNLESPEENYLDDLITPVSPFIEWIGNIINE